VLGSQPLCYCTTTALNYSSKHMLSLPLSALACACLLLPTPACCCAPGAVAAKEFQDELRKLGIYEGA